MGEEQELRHGEPPTQPDDERQEGATTSEEAPAEQPPEPADEPADEADEDDGQEGA